MFRVRERFFSLSSPCRLRWGRASRWVPPVDVSAAKALHAALLDAGLDQTEPETARSEAGRQALVCRATPGPGMEQQRERVLPAAAVRIASAAAARRAKRGRTCGARTMSARPWRGSPMLAGCHALANPRDPMQWRKPRLAIAQPCIQECGPFLVKLPPGDGTRKRCLVDVDHDVWPMRQHHSKQPVRPREESPYLNL